MSLPDVAKALRVDGRMCWDPTDLTLAYPHGGTALGLITGNEVNEKRVNHRITAEELGGVVVDAVYTGIDLVITALLAAWDNDALELGYQDTSVGTVTGRRIIHYRTQTEDVRAGGLVSAKAGILYFSPLADQHPGVLFHNALPMPQDESNVVTNNAEMYGKPFQWIASPDDNGKQATIGLRQDLDAEL